MMMMMMMMMVLFMDMEKSWCHHWCWIWGAKYIIQKRKLARPFITFAKHLSRWFEWKMKNKIINTNTQTSCTTTEYVKLTTGMYHNIHFPSFKYEHTGPTYYILPSNIYGLGIHDNSNNMCSVYTYTEYEGKKGTKNIASCLICWLNENG